MTISQEIPCTRHNLEIVSSPVWSGAARTRRKTNLVYSDACRRPLVVRFKKFCSGPICNI